jgi:16S rRNA (adenine1518-N6/adenine1519-N6)-dimethyltransferase
LQPLDVHTLLKQYGLQPNKRLGQNFLVDEIHLETIVREAGVGPQDEVLEVGAGLGSLSGHLATAAGRLVAVELDDKLLPPLRDSLAEFDNVEVVQADILALDLSQLFSASGFRVVANIPYYLTSKLIRHLLESEPRPGSLALTVQREVAERACAEPPAMSLLTLSVQLYGQPRIAHHIPAGAFYPVPKVDSALLLIDLFDAPEIRQSDIERFFMLAQAGFRQKRKTLANSLAALPDWDKAEAAARLKRAGIDPQRRPQTLTLEEWGRLL